MGNKRENKDKTKTKQRHKQPKREATSSDKGTTRQGITKQ